MTSPSRPEQPDERPTNGWDVLGCLVVAGILAIPGIIAALGGLR